MNVAPVAEASVAGSVEKRLSSAGPISPEAGQFELPGVDEEPDQQGKGISFASEGMPTAMSTTRATGAGKMEERTPKSLHAKS